MPIQEMFSDCNTPHNIEIRINCILGKVSNKNVKIRSQPKLQKKIDLDVILSRSSALWMYKSTKDLTILCNEEVGAHKIKNLILNSDKATIALEGHGSYAYTENSKIRVTTCCVVVLHI